MQEEPQSDIKLSSVSVDGNQKDEIERKIFVGGLPYYTNDENLSKYFGQFGSVEKVMIMKDKYTEEPRGFAFVTFSDTSGATEALKQTSHSLLGKKIETKKALPKGEISKQFRFRKLFVGGIDPDIDEDELVKYFSKFGKVNHAQIIKNKSTGRSRQFGFVTLEDVDSVQSALGHRPHILKDKEMEVKPAEPKRHKVNNFYPYMYGQQLYYVPNTQFDYYMMNFVQEQDPYNYFTNYPFPFGENINPAEVDILPKELDDKLNL